jgi:hypothetical protein
MSSHREAPEISQDPVADSTDLYAFVSPDLPGTVTLIANYIPLQPPAGGPNFYEFGDDVLYTIEIDNDADALPEISFHFHFQTELRNPNTFLYNTGPITSLDSANWNRRQFYDVVRVDTDEHGNQRRTVLASHMACPPCNIGPRSTPNYEQALGAPAARTIANGINVFAGQRAEGFYVDLGSIFDLGGLRPFNSLHLLPLPTMPGVNATKLVNVHSIALQVPINQLTADGATPTSVTSPTAVIGVWATASRPKVRVRGQAGGTQVDTGPWTQVSRLGNPLINEAIIPMGSKDLWNSLHPANDAQFLPAVQHPELATLIPILYQTNGKTHFPNLAGLTAPRADLVAILMTGIPNGVLPNVTFQNYTGTTIADMLRLNMAVPPTTKNPNVFGILGGDLAGFPNGRRVFDDVVTIELRAIAGATYPLVNKSYTPDAAAALVTDGLVSNNTPPVNYLPNFPYLNTPSDGYDVPSA